MDISMFFKFPEILIFIGIILLIIAIIIGISAYRAEDSEDDVDATIIEEANENVISEQKDSDEMRDNVPIKEESIEPEIAITEEPVTNEEDTLPDIIPLPIEEVKEEVEEEHFEVPEEDYKEVTKEDIETTTVEEPKEEIIETKPVEEPKEEKVEFETTKDPEEKIIDEPLDTSFTDNISEESDITGNIERLEQEENSDYVPYEYEYNPELEATRPIYGGTRPLENIDLHFDEEKHEVYTNYIKPEETKKENQDEEIELL